MHRRKNVYFWNYVHYAIVAAAVFPIVFISASNVWTAESDSSTTQTIMGDPIEITAYGTGRMQVWYNDVYQYFNENCWGSVLMFNDGDALVKYSSPYQVGWTSIAANIFTELSNAMPDAGEIDTVLGAGESGVTVTQKVQYTDGASYYKITWTITNSNSSTKTYTNCKFFHGGDAWFGGHDGAQAYWDGSLGMVYLRNEHDEGVTGIMGFYGGLNSRADAYFGGIYSTGNNQALGDGQLSNEVDSNYRDAGYYLQWNRDSLAPGETWTITAYEKWTDAGNVQVMAPAEQTVTKGETVDLTFTIQNFQSADDTFAFEAISALGWPISYPDGNTVPVPAGQTATVTVRIAPPAGSDTSDDTITLTVTSSTNAEVFNSDSVKITGTPSEVITPEEPGESTGSNHHNDYCFVSVAGSSPNAGILILAVIFLGLGYLVRFGSAEVRTDK